MIHMVSLFISIFLFSVSAHRPRRHDPNLFDGGVWLGSQDCHSLLHLLVLVSHLGCLPFSLAFHSILVINRIYHLSLFFQQLVQTLYSFVQFTLRPRFKEIIESKHLFLSDFVSYQSHVVDAHFVQCLYQKFVSF